MAVELASAFVSIIPTTKGIASNLEKELTGPLNAAAKKAGDEAGKTMKRSLDDVGKSFTKLGIGGLAVAGVLGAGLLKTGQAASHLGESINAVQVTFGKAAGGILKLGEQAADSVGLSNAAFNGLAVQFSAFATTVAGKGGDVVAIMKDLTGRGADFASVMDIDVADAMTLFQSGLAGETEPLRKYGIDLSAAAVKNFALAHSIGETGRELTEAEKVQARYGLLMESTSKTQGDFANTADSAANATRRAQAKLENASASLGAAFTPAMAFAAEKVAGLADAFIGLNDATGGWLAKGAGIAVIALGAASAVSLVVGQVIKFRGALTSIKGAFVSSEGGLTRLGAAASKLGPLLVVAGVAAVGMGLRARSQAGHIREMAEAIGELSTAADKDVLNSLFTALAQGVIAGKGAVGTLKEMAHANLEGTQRALELAEAQGVSATLTEALRQAIAEETRARAQGVKTTEEHGEALDDVTTKLDPAIVGTDALKLATEGFTKATDEAKRKSEAFTDSLERQRNKTDELFGIERSAVDAKYAFAESSRQALVDTDLLNQALASGKTKQEDLTTATDNAKSSILKASEDYATLKGAALDSEGGIRRQIESLEAQRDQLAPGAPLRAFLDGYIKDLENIPSNVSTILDLHISSGAVTTKTGDLDIGVRSGRHALGGYVKTPWQIVGEEGPELAELPRGSFIHTAAATRLLMASSMAGVGGAVPPIVLNNYRRDIGVADINQVLAMARLAS